MRNAARMGRLRGALAIAVMAMGIGFMVTGCGRSPDKNPDIPATSFRADPSRMTPEEKANFEKLTGSGGGKPAAPAGVQVGK